MAVFNPTRPAYREDPYPSLAALRKSEPVHWSRDLGAWVVTSYSLCFAAAQDEALSVDPLHSARGPEMAAHRATVPLGEVPVMATVDDPVHDRLRRAAMRSFSPRAVEADRERIAAAVRTLLEPVDPRGPFDVVHGLAEPLAVSTRIGHLGVPEGTWAAFREAAQVITMVRTNPRAPAGAAQAAGEAADEVRDLLRSGAFDPHSVVAAVREALGEISEDEALMLLVHASLSGNGPTTMALGNMVLGLARHPEEYASLREHRDLVPAAVEELLRHDSPVQALARWAREDTRLGSRTIRRGQTVFLMLGAANRDPAQYPDPDRLDLRREDTRHLAFSHGPHFCLGAPLARLELTLALAAIVERWPSLEVVTLERLEDFLLRGPRRLVVRSRP